MAIRITLLHSILELLNKFILVGWIFMLRQCEFLGHGGFFRLRVQALKKFGPLLKFPLLLFFPLTFMLLNVVDLLHFVVKFEVTLIIILVHKLFVLL